MWGVGLEYEVVVECKLTDLEQKTVQSTRSRQSFVSDELR